MKRIRAVITADIVNSSMLGKGAFNALIKSIEKFFNTAEIIYSFYRGDSFYALCDVSVAFISACLLRTIAIQASEKESEKEIDIRMAIGIGNAEEPFKDLGTAKGDAFVLSGREMDRLEKEGPRLSIRCKNNIADLGLSAIALFTDFLLKKMTVKQAAVIHSLLQGFTQVEVARKLGKTQSTINKHAGAANWNELVRLIEIYEKLTSQLIDKK
ncbi:MAG: hypothetical protein JW973_08790 [Bacteroidales bacterium]|nr:hypothetical protein [Bacteroidales bacterium]